MANGPVGFQKRLACTEWSKSYCTPFPILEVKTSEVLIMENDPIKQGDLQVRKWFWDNFIWLTPRTSCILSLKLCLDTSGVTLLALVTFFEGSNNMVWFVCLFQKFWVVLTS